MYVRMSPPNSKRKSEKMQYIQTYRATKKNRAITTDTLLET